MVQQWLSSFGLLIVALLLISGCKQSNDRNNTLTEQQVAETIRSYDKAWGQKDTAAVSGIMGKEYRYFSSRGGVRSRSWILGSLLGNPSYQIDSLDRSELTVRVFDNAAVAGSRWQGYGSYAGEQLVDDQRCSQVFVLRNNGLFLVSEHCTDIAS